LAALIGRGDAVYVDRLAHACLIDGARVSGATLRVFPHNDVDRLERAIARDAGRFRRSLIAVDAVYSMDGDLAPLADLAAIADRFDAILLADEAHGTGVYGPDGRGASAELGVAERVHVRVGTLSKALGSAGGFVAGSRALVEWMIQAARPLIYSTAMPAPSAAAATRALAIARAEPWRRERARALGSRLRGGIEGARAGSGPIVPLILGDTNSALAATARLRDRGFLAPAIRPPTVPEGTARLRLSASAAHTEADVDALIEALAEQAAGG